MTESHRFDVRVAGGHAIARSVGMAMASAQALAAAHKGYRVWVRETSRQSWAAGTLVLARTPDGSIEVICLDPGAFRFHAQFIAMINELEANVA